MKKIMIILAGLILVLSTGLINGCSSIDERQEMGHDYCAE